MHGGFAPARIARWSLCNVAFRRFLHSAFLTAVRCIFITRIFFVCGLAPFLAWILLYLRRHVAADVAFISHLCRRWFSRRFLVIRHEPGFVTNVRSFRFTRDTFLTLSGFSPAADFDFFRCFLRLDPLRYGCRSFSVATFSRVLFCSTAARMFHLRSAHLP